MKKRIGLTFALLAGSVSLLLAHDLFIKLDTYFLEPNTEIRVPVINGTFETSENAIAPERVIDISLVTPSWHDRLDTTAWHARGDTTFVDIRTHEPGTYVLGASTRPNMIQLTGEEFNQYLEHDGIPDVLEARRRNNELDKGARERYHKHVKAIFQVGDRLTRNFGAVLGYPAELVPLDNPYELRVGSTLRVRCLVDGEPVDNQLVIAGGEREGKAFDERSTRSDADGVATITIRSAGKWYVKFINMTPSPDEDVDYESKWATLTFEVKP